MTLQASGAIALSEIQSEFGGSNPISLSEYYRGGSYVSPTLDFAINAATWTNSNQVIRYSGSSTYTFIWGGTVVCTATGSNLSSGLDNIAGTTSGHTIYRFGCGNRLQNYSSYQRWAIWRKNKAAYDMPTSGQISMNQFYSGSNSA